MDSDFPLTTAEYRWLSKQEQMSRPVSEKPTAELLYKISKEFLNGRLTNQEYIERTTMVCFDYAVEQHPAA